MTVGFSSKPRDILIGTKDVSTRQPVPEDIAIPTHLQWMPTFAEKGDGVPAILRKNSAARNYGNRTFDEASELATHQTPFINLALSNGNPVTLQRIIPDGAKTAMLRISVEVIKADLPIYERTESGAYKYEYNQYEQRVRVIKETKEGVRLVFHTTVEPWKAAAGQEAEALFGAGTVIDSFRAGTISAADGTKLGNADETSGLYPLLDFQVNSPGSYGNRLGLRLQIPHGNSVSPADTATIWSSLAYLYRLGVVEKDRVSGEVTMHETNQAELTIDVSLKEGARSDRLDIPMTIDPRFINAFKIEGNGITPDFAAPFNKLKVYRENIQAVAAIVMETEKAYNDDRIGFGSMPLSDANPYLVNFLGGYDELGIPYFTVDTEHSALFDGVAISADTTLYASGGDDGLIVKENGEYDTLANLEIFDSAVRKLAENFDNTPSVRYTNYAKYPFSAIWDSGYSVETKKAFLNILTLRKDVAVVNATYALADYVTVNVGGVPTKKWSWLDDLSPEEEVSLAGILRTYASLHPESEAYGTPCCRALVIGYSGRVINGKYTRRLPLSYEYLNKVSKFMGSPSGIWNGELAYDLRGNNFVDLMTDVSTTWLSEQLGNQAWSNGLVYVEDFDTARLFFPGIRTVYSKETSVLNADITMWAICLIERVCHLSWRELSGNSKWGRERFAQESDKIITDRLTGVFDDRFQFRVSTTFDEADKANGFSWSCVVDLYANNMLTVGKHTVVAHRMEDYTANAA